MITLNRKTTIQFSNMGLFVGGAGWTHPETATATHELVFVVKGEVFLEEDGERHALKEGDVLCLKPDTVHKGYKKSDNCSFFWLHFYADAYEDIGVYRARAEDFSSALVLFKELNHLASLQGENELIECKLLGFLLQLNSRRQMKSKLFSDIADYIRVNGYTPLSVSSVSEKFGYNSDYLSKLFTANCGIPLKKYIDRARLSYLCNLLLATTLSVKEISERCGFESDNALIKFFKYHKKQTPSEYRNSISLSHTNNK
ncbi:MAG: hypothetical protein DBX59_08040 [Bacillota bacterium]|nr:MAG: hypothetical protein DBX59_08040 [Bacillota bacterium]